MFDSASNSRDEIVMTDKHTIHEETFIKTFESRTLVAAPSVFVETDHL